MTASRIGSTDVPLFKNSKLVANQCGGYFEERDERMEAYHYVLRIVQGNLGPLQ